MELKIGGCNMTTHTPVCAKCPPVVQELVILPKYPSGYRKGIFSGSTLSVREKQFQAHSSDESLKQYGLTSSSSTDHWVVGTTTSKTSAPQLPTAPWSYPDPWWKLCDTQPHPSQKYLRDLELFQMDEKLIGILQTSGRIRCNPAVLRIMGHKSLT